MSYGAIASSATIIRQDLLISFFSDLGIDLEFQNLDDLYSPFSDFEMHFTQYDFVDCFEAILGKYSLTFSEAISDYLSEEEIESLQEAIAKVERFQQILAKAEKITGLRLYLLWVEGDGEGYDDLHQEFAIELSNVYRFTEPGEKYKDYIFQASWVVYG